MPYCAAPKLVKTVEAATLANRSLYHGHELSELVHNPRNSVTQAIMMQRLRIADVLDFILHNFFDVGCGAGFALLTALDTGFMRPVVGIDWDDHMLQNITRPCLEGQGYAHGVDFLLIKANVREEGSAEWIRGNLRGRGFADNFGFVYCEGVVECAPAKDRAKILVNCCALGLPGGILHVSMNLLRPSLNTHDADLERRGIEPVAAVGSLVLMKEGPPGLWGDDVQTTPVYAALAIQVSPESAWGLAEAQVQHELLRILGLDLDSADWLRIGDAEEFFLTQAEGCEVAFERGAPDAIAAELAVSFNGDLTSSAGQRRAAKAAHKMVDKTVRTLIPRGLLSSDWRRPLALPVGVVVSMRMVAE